MPDSLLCPPADVALDAQGHARAPKTEDVYFSADDGLAESRAVFLAGADLPARWQNRTRFTVAELGFGTGLNIVALLHLWQQSRPPGGRLHIVTVEGRPLSPAQATAALEGWPEVNTVARKLLSVWPPPWKGTHRRRLDDLHTTITWLHDDVESALRHADFRADAWFLDGFAPARNPSMWTQEVFDQVARLSAAKARAATYTVAGPVRRGLGEAGFEVHRRPGFGRKRERLEADFHGRASTASFAERPPRLSPQPGPVTIIGGGIAAAALAAALRARGRESRLVAHRGLGRGASGGPAGLLTPRLEATALPHVRATMAAFAFSRKLFEATDGLHPEGALRFAVEGKKSTRLERIAAQLGRDFEWVDAARAAALTGVREAPPGIFMHQAARFDPRALVRALADDTPIIDARIVRLRRHADTWRALDETDRVVAESPTMILAGGAATTLLAACFDVPLRASAGYVGLHAPGASPLPRAPLAWGGYASAAGRAVLVGATHEPDADPGDLETAHARLLSNLRRALPVWASGLGPRVGVWHAVRATTKDRLPMVGPIADGLGLLSGLGGRGFAHAPLLAELLADDLDDAPAALDERARAALHPRRFRRAAPPRSTRG